MLPCGVGVTRASSARMPLGMGSGMAPLPVPPQGSQPNRPPRGTPSGPGRTPGPGRRSSGRRARRPVPSGWVRGGMRGGSCRHRERTIGAAAIGTPALPASSGPAVHRTSETLPTPGAAWHFRGPADLSPVRGCSWSLRSSRSGHGIAPSGTWGHSLSCPPCGPARSGASPRGHAAAALPG